MHRIAWDRRVTMMVLAVLLASRTAAHATPEIWELEDLDRVVYELTRSGSYSRGEQILLRVLEFRERTFGPVGAADVTREYLVKYYRYQRRLFEAENLLKAKLWKLEEWSRADTENPERFDEDIGITVNKLASVIHDQGRYVEAEALYRHSLVILEKRLGFDHTELALAFNNLGTLLSDLGRTDDAEPVYKYALAIREKAFGHFDSAVGTTLLNLALLRMQQNLYAEAEILLRDVVTIWEKTLDSRHEDLALALRKLAITLSAQSDHNGALKMMRRSNALESSPSEPVWKAYLAGPRWPTCQSKGEHPTLCYTVLLPPDEYEPGEVLAGFSDRSHNEESNGRIAGRLSEHSYAMAHARIAWRAGYPRLTPPLVNETFEAAQRASATETASVLARAAARFAATDDVLIRLIRELEDLNERRLAPDPTLAQALELPSGEHRIRAQEARFWHKLDEVMERIAYINARIDQSFPNYRELVSPEPASITDVQTLLTGQEALVTYLTISPDQDLREEAGLFIWLVRPDRGEMRRVEVGEGEIAATVTALRAQLDPGQGGGRGPFDVAAAHALYRKLLPFDAASLEGIKHLYVVPHGPLESLPFSVLVASDPGQAQGDYRKVDWLVRHYAVTTLPAVSTLRALRRFAKPSRAPEPFRGVGNPVLRGYAGTERKLAADLFDARGLVDPALLRAQPALPNTALELKALAQTLGAKDKALLLGPKVTETAIKRGDLGKARIVAFATHAAIAGQLDGLAEPGLILTPPEQASEADDGYLAASEAAQLKLDADLVLLSACNTAAPDGTPGAPGLSGLAKAFIYAGARALLVSHWDVYDRAGRLLTTGMLKEERKDPALGHAEALRRSMLKLLDAGEQPYLRHPAAWAPFVIVGQGGAAAGAASR